MIVMHDQIIWDSDGLKRHGRALQAATGSITTGAARMHRKVRCHTSASPIHRPQDRERPGIYWYTLFAHAQTITGFKKINIELCTHFTSVSQGWSLMKYHL